MMELVFLTVATIAFVAIALVAIAIFLFVIMMRTPGPILPPPGSDEQMFGAE